MELIARKLARIRSGETKLRREMRALGPFWPFRRTRFGLLSYQTVNLGDYTQSCRTEISAQN